MAASYTRIGFLVPPTGASRPRQRISGGTPPLSSITNIAQMLLLLLLLRLLMLLLVLLLPLLLLLLLMLQMQWS